MDLSKMNKIGHSEAYDKNNIILDEQCTDTSVYIVLQGEVEVIEKARNSIFHIKTGEFFGGIPIIQDSIRLYTVKALVDKTIVYHIQASTYRSLIDRCPEVYVKIFSNLLKRVKDGIDKLNEIDPVAATLYKLNSIYARINLLKEYELEDMVKNDLNYTVFVMRFLSDLSNKLNLNII